jgi:hypothetical protein
MSTVTGVPATPRVGLAAALRALPRDLTVSTVGMGLVAGVLASQSRSLP